MDVEHAKNRASTVRLRVENQLFVASGFGRVWQGLAGLMGLVPRNTM